MIRHEAGLKGRDRAAAEMFMLLQRESRAGEWEAAELAAFLGTPPDPALSHRYFFTSGPVKPNAMLKYVVAVCRSLLRARQPPRLIVIIDGIGFYAPAAWRKARVMDERRMVGVRGALFSAIWEARRALLYILERLRIARSVDIWLELGRLGYRVSPQRARNSRLWLGQPLVEDFHLTETETRLLAEAIEKIGADRYLPHPRSVWHPPLPRQPNERGDPAELVILASSSTAVGFCTSTLYNLQLLGAPVEFVPVPRELAGVRTHGERLREANGHRLALLHCWRGVDPADGDPASLVRPHDPQPAEAS